MNLVADANSIAWGFWEHWADGRWEPQTHQTILDHCHGGTFVDIGAWVGPTSIWAAQAGYGRVVAVEPDPFAFEMLQMNTEILPMVERYDFAITDRDGSTYIEQRGDSMARTDVEDADHPQVITRCLTVETMFTTLGIGSVDLIKMDVEGAEFRILDQAEPFLRTLGAPIHLSLHPWGGTPDQMRSILDGWTIEELGDGAGGIADDAWLVTP